VNDFVSDDKPLEILQIDETVARRQAERLRTLRHERSRESVERALAALRKAAEGRANMMPAIYEAVKAYATLGEINRAMKDIFGEHKEPVKW
jgi:methylmalonyl-CoA mutase N-terminal domain/subunit